MTTIGRRPRGPAVLCLLVSVLLPFIAEVWNAEAAKQKLTFPMVPSSDAIKSCLPNATATVTVTGAKNNQIMEIKAEGLAPNTEYDLFVIQVPHAKFGIAWYQSDLETDKKGKGSATVR